MPAKTYAIPTGKVTLYDYSGNAIDTSKRYIDGKNDLCEILHVYKNGYCEVKYPSTASSTGYNTQLAKFSDFSPSPNPAAYTANKDYPNAYRRATGSETIGSVDKGDACLQLATSGGRMQVIYPIPGGHKIGWIEAQADVPKHAIDLNRSLNGTDYWELAECGTVDIYINGNLDANDVSDYWKEWPEGTRYEVKDIKTKEGYAYKGVKGGSTSGTVGKDVVDLRIVYATVGKEMSGGCNRVLPDGDYMIVSAADPSYYLDIPGGDASAPNGSNVQLYGPNGGTIPTADTWTITYSDGFYSICQNGSNAALDVKDVSAELGANVQVWQKNANNGQKWAINYFDGGKGYRVQSKCSGMSLDITGGTVAAGTNIEMYTGNSSDAQRWLFIPKDPGRAVEDGRYVLVSGLDPHVELDVSGDTGDVADGTNVQVWGDRAQSRFNSFDVKYAGDGYYHLVHAASGKYLEVDRPGTDNYGNIEVTSGNGLNNQKWCFIPQNGGYMLANRHSGLAMDVADGKTADGTNVRQHYYNGSNAQTWILKKAEYTVKYDANGGTGAPAAQTKYYANALELSSSEPSFEGRIFKGWAAEKNAAKAQYQPGGSYSADADVTLYAVWETPEAPAVTGISITRNPDRTSYDVGDALDTDGLRIEASYSDGTAGTITSGFTCAPEVLDTAGTQTITVEYEGKTATFQVTVNAKANPNPGSSGKVSVSSMAGSPGTTVAVPIRIDENPGLIGINLSLGYDAGRLKLVKVESGELLDGSSLSSNYTKNPYRLSFSNEMSEVNIEGPGILATAYFEILADAGEGDTEVTLAFEEAYDKDLNEVSFKTANGKVAIQSYKPGDVNRDGQVKLNDAILLRRYVAGWDVEIDLMAADVNRDGQVRLNDAIILRRYVAGWDVVLK